MSRALIGKTAAVLTWVFASCAAPPPDSERVDESIVITKYAPGTDFGSYQTYYLRPEIRVFKESGEDEPLDADVADPLLDLTRKNLDSRGYTETAAPSEADLGVEVMYTDQINTTYWCYYWWDPYYWGYPAWGYYPYYGGCDTTMWRSGMLGTVMVDLVVARENEPGIGAGGEGGGPGISELPGIWASGVYGAGLTSADARDGINQAFKQSPYLRAD
jgi:hypothetical protein